MGKRSKARHKGIGKNRKYKRGVRDLKHRGRDLDQIHEALYTLKRTETDANVPKYELAGNGMYYCQFCDRYFMDEAAIQSHAKEKKHKRRIKTLENYVPYDG